MVLYHGSVLYPFTQAIPPCSAIREASLSLNSASISSASISRWALTIAATVSVRLVGGWESCAEAWPAATVPKKRVVRNVSTPFFLASPRKESTNLPDSFVVLFILMFTPLLFYVSRLFFPPVVFLYYIYYIL